MNSLLVSVLMNHEEKPAKFAPQKGKTLVIAGQDLDAIADYKRTCPAKPFGFAVYTSLKQLDGLESESDHGGGRQFASKIAKENPKAALQVGLYMVGELKNTIEGRLDANIERLGRFFKTVKSPIFLRIGYEFDYSENHYDPAEYQAAYKRIVDHLRKQKVSNVAFVWHSYADKVSRPIGDWYPGDHYVDWCAISYFYTGRPQQVVNVKFAKEHRKPLMIAESAPWGVTRATAWADWYAPYFKFIKDNDVAALCYINCDWDTVPMFKDQKWGDSRLIANSELAKQWQRKISEPRYVGLSQKRPH
jgi:hypothetical protein